jgi:hypothetical protein
MIEKDCKDATAEHLGKVLALKLQRYGPHPSKLPGWMPRWRRQMLAARL